MKETLIIYRDWWEAIKGLPTDLQLDAFTSICEYAFEGKEPENPIISAVTTLMRSAIDRDTAKWNDVREKRREAGRKGAIKTNAKRWGESNNPESANVGKSQQMPILPTPPQKEAPSPEPPAPATPEPTEELTKLEKEFDRFRQAYPGNKRGLSVEFGNFKKKYPKKWKEIIPLLMPAVERLLAYHKAAQEANKQGAKVFVPNFAYLATWINQARWEEEFPEIPATGATPAPTVKKETDNEPSDFGGREY